MDNAIFPALSFFRILSDISKIKQRNQATVSEYTIAPADKKVSVSSLRAVYRIQSVHDAYVRAEAVIVNTNLSLMNANL